MKDFENLDEHGVIRVASNWVGMDQESGSSKVDPEKQKELDKAQSDVDMALKELEERVRQAQEAVKKAESGISHAELEAEKAAQAAEASLAKSSRDLDRSAPTHEVASELDWILQFEENQAEFDQARKAVAQEEVATEDPEDTAALDEEDMAQAAALEAAATQELAELTQQEVSDHDQIQEEPEVESAGLGSRRSKRRQTEEAEEDQAEVEETSSDKVRSPFWLPLVSALILTGLSVANPFLSFLANNQEGQVLYAGWAQTLGQTAYGNIYTSNGLVFNLLTWASNLAYGGLLLLALEFIFTFLAGVSAYQLLYSIKPNKAFAKQSLLLFYFLVFLLGFGGLYAAVYALPAVFWVLNRIYRYSKGRGKDEGFILAGAALAWTFLLHPLSAVILAAVSFLVLAVYNISQKRWSRGVYQTLSALLGYSMVFYPLGFYVVWNKTFSMALDQILYPLTSLGLHKNLATNGLIYGLLLLALGFLTALVVLPFAKKKVLSGTLLATGVLGLIAAALLALFNGDQGIYQLIPSLPYALILISAWLAQEKDAEHEGAWSIYMRKSFYLPLFAAIYVLGFPILNQFVISAGDNQDRQQAAQYIKDHAEKGSTIYAWDDDVRVYKASGHLAAATLLSPSLYGQSESNRLALDSQLKRQQPAYVLVNLSVPLSKDVKAMLESDYQAVMLDLDQFTLYQKK